jgi:succinate dehydrogenase / fumarate reductase membrane anchor subunit
MTAPPIRPAGFRPPPSYRAQPRKIDSRGRIVAWVTVRVTGVLLSVLVLGHFGMTHILTDVSDTGTSFIARRWASLTWLIWDWLLLTCALLHGASGVWVAISDYAPDPRRRRLGQRLLVGLSSVILLIGSTAIVVVGRR